jgi:hypothetical protein
MNKFVQSAIEAAKQGDNQKAVAFIKQVLNSNPNDVDAWLVLAAVVDDPQRKRQCLNRVLKLDPVNMMAREELEEMDRAEMGELVSPFTAAAGSFSLTQDEPASVSTPLYQQEPSSSFYSTGTSAFESDEAFPHPPAQTKPQAPAAKAREKTLVFKYPLILRILMYFFIVIFGCGGLFVIAQSVLPGLFFLGIGLIMLVAALALFPTIEISSKSIRVSNFFSSNETVWDEIVKIKSNAMKRTLELTKRNKKVVNISTQVNGYPQIVEIVRKKRPDLFGMAPQAQTSESSSPYEQNSASPTPAMSAFKGTQTFKKSFFRQYGLYIVLIPICFFAAWSVVYEPAYRIRAGIALVICLGGLVAPLFQVSAVKLESNKLTVETLFEEKILDAKDIHDIKMQSVRGRRGSVTNFVNIIPLKGKNYPLQGFTEGDEIIYGTLINWWETYRNR